MIGGWQQWILLHHLPIKSTTIRFQGIVLHRNFMCQFCVYILTR